MFCSHALPMVLACAWVLAGQVAAEEAPAPVPESPVVTSHEVEIDGETVAYTATTGTVTLATEAGKERASVFVVAYTRDGVEDLPSRPVTFAFNGGPGSSSVWLHLGALGPRRALMDENGFPLAPPHRLVDNAFSWLAFTDLVFIDPVTTGYSRAAEGVDHHDFHGLHEDIESVAEVIRLWTTRNERWSSPKLLCGESYGTTRAAGLAGHLQGRHGMYLNGIVLVSSILDFSTARFDDGNDLPYVLFLPTYTATAFYHGRLAPELSKDLGETLEEAEKFALGPYAVALLLGNRIDQLQPGARDSVAEKLAYYTGLSVEYVKECNLRVSIGRFVKELRRDEELTVGRLDSRFTGIDRDAAGERYEYDPSYAAIQGTYTGCLNDYVRRELGYESDLIYEILTGRVHPWNYDRSTNRYVNVTDTLRNAMAENRDLRVFVANGHYDLATPYFATEHTFAHLSTDAQTNDRVTMAYYDAGHMVYIHQPSLEKLYRDVGKFYGQATGHR